MKSIGFDPIDPQTAIMTDTSKKACSICGITFPSQEFIYGNRDNRSYCRACDQAEKAAYSIGGATAATKFREEQRAKWQGKV